jgi:ribonucleoside-diphosphate reductase alpha chain
MSLISELLKLATDLKGVDLSMLDRSLKYVETLSIPNKYSQLANLCRDNTIIHSDWGMLSGRIKMHEIKASLPFSFSDSTARLKVTLNDKYAVFVAGNAEELDNIICEERDWKYNIFAVETLLKSYLARIKQDDTISILETPQYLFLRVATFLWFPNMERIKRTYNDLSLGNYVHASPTLFNCGMYRHQLSSCFLMTVGDSMGPITKSWRDCAIISLGMGGIGINHGCLRHSQVGHFGDTNGIIPWTKILNEILKAVNQGTRRPGSGAVYLPPWHIDIEEFLDLKKATGAEDMRARDLFYALWISDEFMRRVENDEMWTLMCPNKAKGLNEKWGKEFEMAYKTYEEKFKDGKLPNCRQIRARELMNKICLTQIETSMPYMLFKDAINRKSNQKNLGTTCCSNLCCEITEYTDEKNIASCLTGDTLILTDKGMVRIDEITDENVLVPSKHDTDFNLDPTYQNVKLIYQGVKPVYQVDTIGGSSITATEDHLFLTITKIHKNGKAKISYQWKELQDIEPGEKLYYPRTDILPAYKETQKNDWWMTAGWMLGDGWQREDQYGVCFGPTESYAKKKVIAVLDDMYAEKEIKVYDNRPFPREYTQPNGVYNWSSGRKSFIKYIQDTFGMKPSLGPLKILPDKVINSSSLQLSSFLSGLFSADGSCSVSSKSSKSHVSLSSSSVDLLDSVHRVLKCFGIHSYYHMTFIKSRKSWQGNLGIFGLSQLELFEEYIGFGLCPEKQQKLENIVKNYTSAFSHGGKDWVTVKSVNPCGEEDVWDLSLKSGHNFIANGYVVHNCNLANVALNSCVKPDKTYDFDMLERLTRDLVQNLNQTIDRNYYPADVPEIKETNLRTRPLGIGVQGLADTFALMDLAWEDKEARKLNHDIFETMYYAAVTESAELAKRDGKYEAFDGSPASKGLLQFDLWDQEKAEKLFDEHSKNNPNITTTFLKKVELYRSERYNWQEARNKVRQGMRNSLLLALMPTASSAHILGNTECFEPPSSLIYARTVNAGQFVINNKHMVKDLQDIDMWTTEIVRQIVSNKGSLQNVDQEKCPNKHLERFLFLKKKYKTVFEIPQKYLLDLSVDRGKFICQTQSFNCNMTDPTCKKLTAYHFHAWKSGAKTGMYYLRQKAKTDPMNFSLNTINVPTKKKEVVCTEEECLVCQ